MAGLVSPAPAWHETDADGAVEQLYAAHWRPLVRLSALLVRDVGAAEEVVQDAFVTLQPSGARSVTPTGRSPTAAGRRQRLPLPAAPPQGRPRPRGAAARADRRPRGRRAALDTDRREAVIEALAELPRRQREVIALRYYVDLSEAEIAETLGISRGAVRATPPAGPPPCASPSDITWATTSKPLEAPHERRPPPGPEVRRPAVGADLRHRRQRRAR